MTVTRTLASAGLARAEARSAPDRAQTKAAPTRSGASAASPPHAMRGTVEANIRRIQPPAPPVNRAGPYAHLSDEALDRIILDWTSPGERLSVEMQLAIIEAHMRGRRLQGAAA